MFFLKNFLSFLFVAVPILISVAYLTLAERKIMGSMQLRIGPSTVGFLGLLQPLIDGLKLLLKETILPTNSNVFGFILAPIIAFFLSLLSWCLIPFSFNSFVLDLNLSLLLLFVFSSLNVYSIIFSG
jgi:NADH:ubiquinone oxidoreductase subunit H